jgi:hypothetical protein
VERGGEFSTFKTGIPGGPDLGLWQYRVLAQPSLYIHWLQKTYSLAATSLKVWTAEVTYKIL